MKSYKTPPREHQPSLFDNKEKRRSPLRPNKNSDISGIMLNETSFANSDFENAKNSGTIKVQKTNDAEVKNAASIGAINQ